MRSAVRFEPISVPEIQGDVHAIADARFSRSVRFRAGIDSTCSRYRPLAPGLDDLGFGLIHPLLDGPGRFVLALDGDGRVSLVILTVAWPAILLASIALALPTPWRHVMLAGRKECRPIPGKSRPGSFLSLGFALPARAANFRAPGTPESHIGLLPSPLCRPDARRACRFARRSRRCGSLISVFAIHSLIPLRQRAEHKHTLAVLCLGLVHVAAAMPLGDPDGPGIRVEVL